MTAFPGAICPLCPILAFWLPPTPVALDQACLDLVNKTPSLAPKLADAPDKFKARWPHTVGELQLTYGEEIGLGTREYTIENV